MMVRSSLASVVTAGRSVAASVLLIASLLLQAAAPISVAPAAIKAARPRRARGGAGGCWARKAAGSAVAQNGQALSATSTWRLQAGQGTRWLMGRSPRR